MNDKPPRPAATNPKAVDTRSQTGEATRGAPASPSATDIVPALGEYRVAQKLGEGGMGSVYLAEDTRLGRKVAIKTMRPELAADRANRDRFEREARAAAAVEHDNIVPVLHIGTAADGTPFIVMPFLKGESLDARLKREAVAAPGLIVKVALEVSEGLAAAHAAGLIHRDIKPANIWLEGDPASPHAAGRVKRCKVLDFGLARSLASEDVQLTATGAVLGTPAYMAPEQARGAAVDHRADLYSLGATLYRMATGELPFTAPNTMALLFALANEPPRPVRERAPHLPLPLAALIDRLMRKDPQGRPQSAAEVSAAVRQAVKDVQSGRTATIPAAAEPPTPSLSQPVPVVVLPVPAPAPRPRPAPADPWGTATQVDAGKSRRAVVRPRDPAPPNRVPWAWIAVLVLAVVSAVCTLVVIRPGSDKGKQAENNPDADARTRGEKAVPPKKIDPKIDSTTPPKVDPKIDATIPAKVDPPVTNSPVKKADPPAEWVQLFNGKDLTGWESSGKPGVGNWIVTAGAITCLGPQDHLLTTRGDYGDFHLHAEVKINATGNSGIYFRAGKPLTPLGDYEAQICLRADQARTGTLYGQVTVNVTETTADKWFDLDVIADGDLIRILVNGKETARYVETKVSRRRTGHIALQHHDGQTAVAFRKIEIRTGPGLAADR